MQGKHSKKWNTAITKELSALERENTYKLVPRQQGTKTIGSKWVYKVKTKADGLIERFKARLVAKGFSQKHGINYNETFAPVLKHKSLRVLTALIAQYNLHADQMDVDNAFLNPNIEENTTIYMEPPEGLPNAQDKVLVLERSIRTKAGS